MIQELQVVRLIELLNQQLADTFDLYSQAKQAHWNVKGAKFFQLHELFEKLAEELAGYVDLIAERATALGRACAGDGADVGHKLATVRMRSRCQAFDKCGAEQAALLSRTMDCGVA